MQLVNVALGGTLYQDLSMYPQWSVKHGQQPTQPIFATHRIDVEPDSQLSNIYGTTGQVNSYHHQALHTLEKIYALLLGPLMALQKQWNQQMNSSLY